MKYSLGDIVYFEPDANNLKAEWFLGKVVARRHSDSKSLSYYEQYGIEQIYETNKATFVNNSTGGKMLVFCQEDLDRLNNDTWHIYEFASDVIGKSFYTWALEYDIRKAGIQTYNDRPFIITSIAVGNSDEEQDRGGLRYL